MEVLRIFDFKIEWLTLTNHDILIVGDFDIYHGNTDINGLVWAALWIPTDLWQAINTLLLPDLPPPPSLASIVFMEETSVKFNWLIELKSRWRSQMFWAWESPLRNLSDGNCHCVWCLSCLSCNVWRLHHYNLLYSSGRVSDESLANCC